MVVYWIFIIDVSLIIFHLNEIPINYSITVLNLTFLWNISVFDPASQQQQTLALCSEILTLLNNCNPKGLTLHVVTQTLHQWICSSMNAILLIPLLTSACKTLVSVHHMSQLVEVIMEAHFHAGMMTEWLTYCNSTRTGISEMSVWRSKWCRSKFVRRAIASKNYLWYPIDKKIMH